MLEIKNIYKSFGGTKALQGCGFEIEEGKITGLIGPNGAGKTTLFDVISGLIKPEAGHIIFGNYDLTKLEAFEIANLGINRTFQQVRLFKNLSILDHLQMSADNEDTKVFKQLFSPWKTKNQARYNEIIEEFGIKHGLDTIANDLSYGQRKLLQMAMAFTRQHHLLLLDEPVAGVNSVIQKEIERLLLKFKESGQTVMLIEHDIEFVKRLADKVVVMDEGKVLTEGEPIKVLNEKRVLEAYLGE